MKTVRCIICNDEGLENEMQPIDGVHVCSNECDRDYRDDYDLVRGIDSDNAVNFSEDIFFNECDVDDYDDLPF